MSSRAPAEQVADLIGPVCKVLEKEAMEAAEASIAAMALWALDCVEDGRLRPELADEAFTLLVVYLGDHPHLPMLSDEAQELLFEGQHLHHWREWAGGDPTLMRQLADRILARADDGIDRLRARAPAPGLAAGLLQRDGARGALQRLAGDVEVALDGVGEEGAGERGAPGDRDAQRREVG